jgi:hypothetical protein
MKKRVIFGRQLSPLATRLATEFIILSDAWPVRFFSF